MIPNCFLVRKYTIWQPWVWPVSVEQKQEQAFASEFGEAL
jgi:hypothetical protein